MGFVNAPVHNLTSSSHPALILLRSAVSKLLSYLSGNYSSLQIDKLGICKNEHSLLKKSNIFWPVGLRTIIMWKSQRKGSEDALPTGKE